MGNSRSENTAYGKSSVSIAAPSVILAIVAYLEVFNDWVDKVMDQASNASDSHDLLQGQPWKCGA